MKKGKSWRQMKEKGFPTHDGNLTLEDLKKYLTEIFFGTKENPRELPHQNMVTYIREDGTEMIRHEGPNIWGGAMPLKEYEAMLDAQFGHFITKSSDFLKPSKEPITSTKVTLDHGIEVTIAYDGEKES